ncbi:hypothetical protein F5X68DRAFT_263417 [Plectosphaerella plurivora]|uniref:BRCT domain-containing protein n=1 Tax=Plectosphaerella plurivora TaxID=936078 RepID=A0A9P8V7Q0_9PEZI|nr:hypothetical protein F5X68DRAFT_263417 [Plectosphaerella plurivora]
MDPQSPPKRITRARAAKSAGESTTTTRTTRVITAAAKAKMTPAAAAKPTTSTKRKTRSDDAEHDDEHNQAEAASTTAPRPRGRPKKAANVEAEAPAPAASTSSAPSAPGRATRARAAARKAAADIPKSEPAAPAAAASDAPRPRGRPRKNPLPAAEPAPEPPRRTTTTRARASTLTATKPASRKQVTFEEPEKENVHPDANDKAPETTGLRGRPVRKPPIPKAAKAAAPKAAAAAAPTKDSKLPLSPKKANQLATAPDVSMSEDELTADTPVKPMRKLPIKPPSAALGSLSPKKTAPEKLKAPEPTEPETADNEATDIPEVTIASPARRPPASPYKDSLKSPAKRSDGAVLFRSAPSLKSGSDSQATPFKSSLLNSPAKRPQSAIKGLNLPSASRNDAPGSSRSPMKMSLLQSPAKRPVMPIKSFPTPARREPIQEETDNTEEEQPQASPSIRRTSAPAPKASSSQKLMLDEQEDAMHELADQLMLETATLQFPGRLSAVLPRYADPALKDNTTVLYANMEVEEEGPTSEVAEPAVEVVEAAAEPVDADANDEEVMDDVDVVEGLDDTDELDEDGDSSMLDEAESPSHDQALSPFEDEEPQPAASLSPRKPAIGTFSLRDKDTNPYDFDSESEDEQSPSNRRQSLSFRSAVPATPTPARRSIVPPQSASLGFTPLAKQFSTWVARSPAKQKQPVAAPFAAEEPQAEPTPAKTSYFDDEMTMRSVAELQADTTLDNITPISDPEFDDILVTEEDMELAAEADELSMIEPDMVEEVVYGQNAFDDSVSDASQEYGDENAVPVDPAMLLQQGLTVPPKTPRHILQREFHTVSKVPLKAADESTPLPKKAKRSASISRLPVTRPTQGLTRSATVISYSPSKRDRSRKSMGGEVSAPSTPKSEQWSAVGTPARTPRHDINPALLSGAVVFVDVYTSDGADASGIFVELLTQMGARCVKEWDWNPDSAPGTVSSRIGITHVVYKDGGKRTLEKVRETGGVVQCVGVSWVLDCERENTWLDEVPFYISTSDPPRGGARRRKSMEPRAFADMSKRRASSPEKRSSDMFSSPNTPMNRRDSTEWMRTPLDQDQTEEPDHDWHTLTPIPVTPAPDALARYAANLTPETPTATIDLGFDDDDDAARAHLMQTCPPKAVGSYGDLGEGILERKKDEGVMMRLMAARRKSLQFAPKVGSPLARAWK